MKPTNSSVDKDEAGRHRSLGEYPVKGVSPVNDKPQSPRPDNQGNGLLLKSVKDEAGWCGNGGESSGAGLGAFNNNTSRSILSKVQENDASDEEDYDIHWTHSRIVRSWFKSDIDDCADQYKGELFKTNSGRQNLIHQTFGRLSRVRIKSGQKNEVLPQKAIENIEKLVLREPSLFTDPDVNDITPMLQAMKLDNSMLFKIVNLLIPTKIVERLRSIKSVCAKGQEVVCPLWHVNKGRRTQCRKKQDSLWWGKNSNGRDQCEKTDGETITPAANLSKGDGDRSERRCLHADIDVAKVLEENEKLRKTLEKELEKDIHTKYLMLLLTEEKFERIQDGNRRVIPLDSFTTLLWLYPDEVFAKTPASGYTPLQLAIQLYKSQSIDYGLLLSVIESLVKRCPESIFLTTIMKSHMLEDLNKLKTADNEKSISRTEEILKMTCIGLSRKRYDQRKAAEVEDKMWAEKKKFLYWDVKLQQRLCFNLMGESAIISKGYIENIRSQSGMVFETVLDFVKLPYWKPDKKSIMPATKPLNQAQEDQPDLEYRQHRKVIIESDPYVSIFEWLRNDDVRKIFTIDVDDEGPEPHTNRAIRKALGDGKDDFKVEVWKWRKFDICCETVATAVPTAREVHLYSHGNTAVLRGWACGSSLAKMKNLRKLVVEIYPLTASDDEDCKSYEEEFKLNLKRQCSSLESDDILVTNHGFLADRGCSESEKGNNLIRDGEEDKQLQNIKVMPKSLGWISKLENFQDFIINISVKNKLTVKVALLDDGCRLQELEGKQTGQSFRLDNQEYFVGPCSHGTEIARCIRDVCPMAELYIARLDDSRRSKNQKFTMASCHEALQWALSMEVDIICISWASKRNNEMKDDYDQHEKKFVRLITKAVQSRKVLLFGALPGKSSSEETHKYIPVGLDGVFKIGSATNHGQTSPENVLERPDYILPGETIRLSTGEEIIGSSFATAYAAGLAAIVLYCIMAHEELAGHMIDGMTAKALTMARTTKGMKVIFNILSLKNADSSEKGAFVQPDHTFGHEFSDSQDEMAMTLWRIVSEILPQKKLRAFYG